MEGVCFGVKSLAEAFSRTCGRSLPWGSPFGSLRAHCDAQAPIEQGGRGNPIIATPGVVIDGFHFPYPKAIDGWRTLSCSVNTHSDIREC